MFIIESSSRMDMFHETDAELLQSCLTSKHHLVSISERNYIYGIQGTSFFGTNLSY